MTTLVTGAAGAVGAIGRRVVQLLRGRDLPVRALVRRDDDRAAALRRTGAEVVVGDLTRGADVLRVLSGCRRMYFGMGPAPSYLEATVIAACAARELGDLEVLVNMSEMTVSQMRLASAAESPQQHQHWYAEQVLAWSGLPVVEVRPTVFMENPIITTCVLGSIARDGTVRLPFGQGRTSPVLAADVAEVVAKVLAEPDGHLGNVYQLTGPRPLTAPELAQQFGAALGRLVTYVDMPYDRWIDEQLRPLDLPEHLFEHLATMARLHAEGRYDRHTDDIEQLLGRPARGVADFVAGLPAPALAGMG